MNRSEDKSQGIVIGEIVEYLSQLRSGTASGQFTPNGDDKILKPIVDEVNALAQHLHAHIQRYEYILDGAGLGSWDWWLETNEVNFDRRWSKMLGLKFNEILQDLSTWDSLVHPEDKENAYQDIKNYLEGKTAVYENIHRMQHADGHWIWILDRGRISEYDANGKPVRFTGTHFDVSDMKNAEIANNALSRKIEEAEIISKIGFWELDLETYQGKWSKGLLEIFGLSSIDQTPSFEAFISYVHPEDRILLQTLLECILKDKVPEFEVQFRIVVGADKSVRWLKERGRLELNREGAPIGLSGSVQDVTQEKLVELELTETLRTLDATARTLERTGQMAKVGGWELDLSTGRVTMSKETLRIHEIDDNYLPPLYSSGAEWYPPESWPIIQAAVQAAIELHEPYDLESKFITAKGRSIWVRVQGFPVVVAGEVTHLQGTFQDITERKEKDLENKFVGDAMGFGIWKFDPVTKALDWDDRMYTLFGVNSAEFSGAYSAWENALSPKAKEKAVKELELALSGEKELNTEFEITLKSGEIRHIAGRGIVVRNDKGEPCKMYGLNWDVSDRVHAEVELKLANMQVIRASKLASLGEMAAGIAHEINNPLAIIHGGVRALPKFAHDPAQMSKKIETIQAASERIAKIVKSLRKFSRTEDKPVYKLHSLSSIIKEALTLTFANSQQNSTPVQADFESEGYTLCDEIEIEQVMINLINNAIDAVKGRSDKWVKIKVYEDATSIVIRVRDAGTGIDAKVKEKLFQPFFTTKPTGQGTGLGLSIAKGILDEHHASINLVESDPNTCFELRFKKSEAKKNNT